MENKSSFFCHTHTSFIQRAHCPFSKRVDMVTQLLGGLFSVQLEGPWFKAIKLSIFVKYFVL